MNKQTIAIIGCGWLGKKLIAYLEKDYALIGTTGHADSAAQLPIEAYCFDWTNQALPSAINKADHALIAMPPNAGIRTRYPQYMANLASALSVTGHCIMISSTSVYPQQPGHYDESSVPDADSIVYQAEQELRSRHPGTTILRCGGLIGDERIPGKQWLGEPCDQPDQRLNLIHYHDIAHAILAVLSENTQQGQTYNLVHPDHISRHDYYRMQAQRHHAAVPQFANNTINPDRIIDGNLISRELSFTYAYSQLAAYP
ncbi:hypothetical protein KRX19_04880 [Cardiobacteriaceae bacterium TAE3-ERU3]|nr:hypothetical protein [Cardiobacteriaceae bacterium TAE3-ERU3]